jgi:uncharacterized membrane protein (UPF0182 family)
MKNRMVWILLPLALFLFLIFMPQLLSLYVDWLWFKSVLYENLFTVKINAQIISAAAGFIAGFIITFVSIWVSLKATKGRDITTSLYGQEIPRLNVVRHFDKIKIIVPVFVGLFVAMLFSSNWMTFLYSARMFPFISSRSLFMRLLFTRYFSCSPSHLLPRL